MENVNNVNYEKYFGTKEIEAVKMTYGEYANFKYGNKRIDSEFVDDTQGYTVKYADNYISWSPEDPFKVYKKINGDLTKVGLKELGESLLTEDYTYILSDELKDNAPKNYLIKNKENDSLLCGIHFQTGPVNKTELNGVFIPDLIAICIDVIEHFQNSDFKCKENNVALDGLKAAITALRARTNNRKQRGVHGKYEK